MKSLLLYLLLIVTCFTAGVVYSNNHKDYEVSRREFKLSVAKSKADADIRGLRTQLGEYDKEFERCFKDRIVVINPKAPLVEMLQRRE